MKNQLNKYDLMSVARFGTDGYSGTQRYVLDLRGLDDPVIFVNPKDAGGEWGEQKLKGNNEDILLLNSLSKDDIKRLDKIVSDWEIQNNKSINEMTSVEFGGVNLNLIPELEQKNDVEPGTYENSYAMFYKELSTGFYKDLLDAGFFDIYCSTQKHKSEQLIKAEGNMYTRTQEARKIAEIPIGSVIIIRDENGEITRSQQATEEGSLLVVQLDKDGKAMDAYFSNIKEKHVNRTAITHSNIEGVNMTNVRMDYTPVNENEEFITLKEAKRKNHSMIYRCGVNASLEESLSYSFNPKFYINAKYYSGNLSIEAKEEAIKKDGIVVDGYQKDAILITSKKEKNSNISFIISRIDDKGSPIAIASMEAKLNKKSELEIDNLQRTSHEMQGNYANESLLNLKKLLPKEHAKEILINRKFLINTAISIKSGKTQ